MMHNLTERKTWFPIWLDHGKCWSRAIAYAEKRKEEETVREQKRVWLTLDQSIDVFKSEVVGTAVFNETKKEPHTLAAASRCASHPTSPPMPHIG